MGLCAVELHYTPPSAWLTLGVLLATGLTLALLNLYFQVQTNRNSCNLLLQKSLTVLGSSLYGGAILMVTTDYFLEDSLVLNWVWERVKVDRMVEEGKGAVETLPQCWMAWLVTAIWPTIFLVGLCVQACCTGQGIHHQQSLPQVTLTGSYSGALDHSEVISFPLNCLPACVPSSPAVIQVPR